MIAPPHPVPIHHVIDTVWRMESARVIAALVRMVRDVGLAEELAQDALVAALERWPSDGVPDNPGAWLMTTARNRAIDRLRHLRLREEKHVQVAWELEQQQEDARHRDEHLLDDTVGDDVLRLMFIACHPVLPPDSRVALTLRLLGGLETGQIARAFLSTEATVAQRIVRAKRTLAEARIPFELPRREQLPERLAAVLGVIYLVFNEGYAASSGGDWMRPGLCEEALRLGRILAGLMPGEPEVHGLVALMELQASRLQARTGADGHPVLLPDQDRSRWDRRLIESGLEALERARRLERSPGPYALQAAIAACHAAAASSAATDWPRIVALYDALARLAPSPVVELNRAVAVSMASGPHAALPLVDALQDDRKLAGYHLLPSVRGDLLFRLGRMAEAAGEFERAAAMTGNLRERDLLLARARHCTGVHSSGSA